MVNNEKHDHMALIAIVAIVAIVGLFLMFFSQGSSAEIVSTENSVASGDLSGQAIGVLGTSAEMEDAKRGYFENGVPVCGGPAFGGPK